jgi:hypothetical protein
VDRKQACLIKAAACRTMADADPKNRDRWIDEAIKWTERAMAPPARAAVTFEKEESFSTLRGCSADPEKPRPGQ